MVVSERQVVGEEATSEVRYYIGSKPGSAQEYAGYIRGHWGIGWWVTGVARQRNPLAPGNLRQRRTFGAGKATPCGSKTSVRRAMALTHHRGSRTHCIGSWTWCSTRIGAGPARATARRTSPYCGGWRYRY